MRVGHYLRANKHTETPHSLIFFDTETIQRRISAKTVSHHLGFAWACYQRTLRNGEWSEPEWARFESSELFWLWVERRTRSKTKTYLIAHNAGFDLRVMDAFRMLPAIGWKLHRAIVEDPPTMITWRKDHSTITALDTLNWFRLPLKVIGEHLGLTKLDMPSERATRVAWDDYCKRDVEIIRMLMMEWLAFLKCYDLGGFSPTLASQALRAYRHRFMDELILIDTTDQALRLARASYLGGRTECFRLGRIKGPITILDINAEYPYVMRENDYPSILQAYHARASVEDVCRWLKRYCLVAQCWIDTDEPAYPVRRDGKLCFPVGRFVALLTTPDIEHALARGHLTKVGRVCCYQRSRLFTRWVNEIYQLRRDAVDTGNSIYAWLLKIMMNSLYGKFGQRGCVWQEYETTDDMSCDSWIEYDAVEGITRKLRRFGGIVQELSRTVECATSHPAIAAHVTAYGRRLLWDLCKLAGRDRVVYVDTDSIFLTGSVPRRLASHIHESRLGALKIEKRLSWVYLYGLKDYAYAGRSKHKGIRTSAVRLTPNAWEQDQWSSLRASIRRDGESHPTTSRIVRRRVASYTKGTVTGKGHVLPLRLDEW